MKIHFYYFQNKLKYSGVTEVVNQTENIKAK